MEKDIPLDKLSYSLLQRRCKELELSPCNGKREKLIEMIQGKQERTQIIEKKKETGQPLMRKRGKRGGGRTKQKKRPEEEPLSKIRMELEDLTLSGLLDHCLKSQDAEIMSHCRDISLWIKKFEDSDYVERRDFLLEWSKSGFEPEIFFQVLKEVILMVDPAVSYKCAQYLQWMGNGGIYDKIVSLLYSNLT